MDIYFENMNQAHVHMVLPHSKDKPEQQNPSRAADSQEGVGSAPLARRGFPSPARRVLPSPPESSRVPPAPAARLLSSAGTEPFFSKSL